MCVWGQPVSKGCGRGVERGRRAERGGKRGGKSLCGTGERDNGKGGGKGPEKERTY